MARTKRITLETSKIKERVIQIINEQRREKDMPALPRPILSDSLEALGLDCFDGSEILHELEWDFKCDFAALHEKAQLKRREQGYDPADGYEQSLTPKEIIKYVLNNGR